MNSKIRKIEAEIGRTKTKIVELQSREKELERQKTETENTEIVAAFRSANIAPEDLPAVIAAFKKNAYGPLRQKEQEEKRIEKA